ncbi:MAG: oligosaccharide flippase family protein, partial [Pseudomonadota bacterium]
MPLKRLGSSSLMARSFRGSALTTATKMFDNAFRLISNLILVRLLAPEAFGLFGIALTINQLTVMFTDIGIGKAVIRHQRGEEPVFCNTAFVTRFGLHTLLYLFVLLVAAALMTFPEAFPENSVLRHPDTPALVAITGLQLILSGLQSSNLWMAQRQLLLGRLTILSIVGSLVSIVVTILSASLGLGVWSFVLGLLTSQVFNTVGTHVFLPGIRNSWQWDRTVFREIFGFGKWLVPASMAGFFLNQG